MSAWVGFRCTQCAKELPPEAEAGLCPSCKGILFAAYDTAALARRLGRRDFEARPPAMLERWAELMPVRDAATFRRVSLGEQASPLLESEPLARAADVSRLLLKMDAQLPTGSLKDRPMSAVMCGAVERKAPVVCMASSGNAGASMAAHAARAGLQAVIGVFAGVPAAKLCKIRVHAPTVVQVAGGMDDAEEAIQSLARRGHWFNGEAFVNPYALEGEKTIAYELAIQCGWDPPDAVVFPLGSAACVVASYKGFQELAALGCIGKMPRLIGVQFSACAPIAAAFAAGQTQVARFQRTPSFSSTLMHEKPFAGELALRIFRETGGIATAATDDEVRAAMGLLGQGGIFAEPAGAIALAGVMRLRREGRLEPNLRVACLVSGNGLNYIEAAPQGGRLTEPLRLDAIHAMAPEALVG